MFFGAEQAQLAGQLEEVPFQSLIADKGTAHPRHYHQVAAKQELLLVETIDFPQAPPDPVSGDGVAQLFPSGNAQPIFCRAGGNPDLI